MAAMEELGTLLHSLQALKAPGITKSKIDAITTLCVENVQSDAIIVPKILEHFAKSAVTHKLGVLYVIDSISRQWLDRAKKTGQAISKHSAPGTFASGVQRITDALPALMTDIIQSAPEDQKVKITKLLDIWERGQTFPHDLLTKFKQMLQSPNPNQSSVPRNGTNTAAHGSLANLQSAPNSQAPAVPTQDMGALLAALAGGNQQQAPVNPPPVAQPQLSFASNVPPAPPPAFVHPQPVAPVNAQPAAIPGLPGGVNEIATQILQAMSVGTITKEQGLQVLNALAMAQSGGVPMPAAQPVAAPQALPPSQPNSSHDRFDHNGSRVRDRSRSPGFANQRRSPPRVSPPNRRNSPTYGIYDPNSSAQDNFGHPNDQERGRGKNRGGRQDHGDYRQRSPPRRMSSPRGNGTQNGAPKFIEWDDSIPRDSIRILSRTLFVGGAGGTEAEIRHIFSRFGRVQTCIVNLDKRHAFVKMMTRPDAVAAKQGMDMASDAMTLSKARQTRWGVGFGPRDCSDYETGISVIPISRLTDADRKWVVTAEHGGTGGQPLEGRMVLEEPDIEIGAGVSSKAISRRNPPEAGRGRGGFGGGRGGPDNAASRFRKADRAQAAEPRHMSPRPEPVVAVPPAVPGFGFQLPGMPGY